MLKYIKEEANGTFTENGAAAYLSTGSDCLDFFASVGALRRACDGEIIRRFTRAYTEDPDIAMKILFFARDVRGGLGERRVFRVIFRWLASHKPASVRKNIGYVAEFGRFDDLLFLMGTPCEKDALDAIGRQYEKDLAALKEDRPVSLMAKWLPSVNTSNREANLLGKKVARSLGLTDAGYRKVLSALRAKIRIIENDLREKNYTFDYEKQPSRALFKYRKAFMRNDCARYRRFMAAAAAGNAKLHADNLSPYELVESCIMDGRIIGRRGVRRDVTADKDVLNATWASLPDFGGDGDVLPVIDMSGSMFFDAKPLPAAVALSLGLYFAERNRGAFKNHFIEFSARPQLIELKGETFFDRLCYAMSFCDVANTDLEAVFDLILDAAVKHNVEKGEIPRQLVIVSDMEFDACVDCATSTVFENAKAKFKACGYDLPQIVFWNVASRKRHQPVRQNEQGVALVSGVTPRLFSMVAGKIVSPYAFMMDALGNERYAKIAA